MANDRRVGVAQSLPKIKYRRRASNKILDPSSKANAEKNVNDILDLYFREGLSLSQIASKYKCNKTSIYRIIKRYKFKVGRKIDDILKDPKPFIEDSWNRLNKMIERLEQELRDLETPRDIINTISEIRNLEISKYELLNQLGWRPKVDIEKVSKIIFEVKESEK